jgi:hypothetical protein
MSAPSLAAQPLGAIIMTRTELQAEALANARSGQSVMNYAAIFEGFMAIGIAEADIKPRENMLTFQMEGPMKGMLGRCANVLSVAQMAKARFAKVFAVQMS